MRSFLRVSEDNPALATVEGGFRETAPWFLWLIAVLLLLTLAAFLVATPDGLLSKADMVGYAVCHQIESHSFAVAGHHLPLCARCTGTFLGALLGLLGHALVLRRGRAARFPPVPVLAILLGFTVAWMADGLNSYLALIAGPHLYEPRNSLRLTTGALHGLTMSALIHPLFNVSVWRHPADEPTLRNLLDLGVLLAMEGVMIGVVLSRWELLLYPLAVLSGAAVLTLLTSVNAIIALILMRRENSIGDWRQTLVPISVGLILSLVQIGVIDMIRFAITGTLEGIPTLQ
jgi:uncharacterized membrane protein